MASSKLRKISKIVKEFTVIKSQSNYDISGLTLSLCKFYYREPYKQFKDLPVGDYTIDTSNNAQTLIIRNPIILEKSESIQVCYQLDLVSSKYQSDFEVDINRLASSYNEAIEDLHDLWNYVKSIAMVADDTTMDLILPQLDTNEVWVKTVDGYKGVSLTDAEGTIKDLIDKYTKERIEQINLETEKYTNTVLKPMLDEYENDKELQLEILTNNQKKEITTLGDNKKKEIVDLSAQKNKEIIDLSAKKEKEITDLGNSTTNSINVLASNKLSEITNLGDSKNKEIIDLSNKKKQEIVVLGDQKKQEINNLSQNKEQSLVDLKDQLAKELGDLVKGAVADKGVMPNGTDWHTLVRGSYYVLDLFNSNFKNHPYQLANQNESKGVVVVTETEQGQSKVITYHSTSKRMFFTILVKSGNWSEWAVLGGGKGSVYEITQPNHGFIFNSITLKDNNVWELANPDSGADAIAIKIDDNRFELLISGQGVIPLSSRDDRGNPYANDEYYFMSTNVVGGIQKEKPNQRIFQPLFHTRTVEGKLVADIEIGEIHDLTPQIVDSNTADKFGLLMSKDFDKDRLNLMYKTIINHFNKIEVVQDLINSVSVLHRTNDPSVILERIYEDVKFERLLLTDCCNIKTFDEPRIMIVCYDRSSSPQLTQVILKEEKINKTGFIFAIKDTNDSNPALFREK